MASPKKHKRELGIPPSHRRRRSGNLAIPGFGSTIPAAIFLDLPRIQGIWRVWYEAGIVERPWDLEVFLELLQSFIRQGLIDWRGMEDVRPKVLDILEYVRTGVLTLEEFQERLDQS